MLSTLRRASLVNVHELSRLARNTKDLLGIVEQIPGLGASIKFHKENMAFNSGEAQDAFQQLMLTMLGAIAKEKGKYKGKRSRFSDTDIQDMKERFAKPETNKSALARDFGITRQHLYRLTAA